MNALRNAIDPMPIARSYPAQFEVRGLAGAKVEVEGYASVTETPYAMWDFYGEYSEIMSAGAFKKTLDESADVAFLINHSGLTLARTVNGTLVLSEDEAGLRTVATVNTSRGDARDLVTAIEDGDITEMSFAFRVTRQQWSPDYDERRILEVNMDRGDVSAVNYGANPFTSIGKRSFRTADSARMARIVAELHEGKELAASSRAAIASALSYLAFDDAAATKVLETQPKLAAAVRSLADDQAAALVRARQLRELEI